jgi:hypothetical protein
MSLVTDTGLPDFWPVTSVHADPARARAKGNSVQQNLEVLAPSTVFDRNSHAKALCGPWVENL